jgi:hypothetical protein
MLPKYSSLDVREYMVGVAVQSFSGSSSTVNVHVPAVMPDKSPSSSGQTSAIPSSLLVSRENIAVAGSVNNLNYIQAKISDAFRMVYANRVFPQGSKVRIYCPDLNLNDATVVPIT